MCPARQKSSRHFFGASFRSALGYFFLAPFFWREQSSHIWGRAAAPRVRRGRGTSTWLFLQTNVPPPLLFACFAGAVVCPRCVSRSPIRVRRGGIAYSSQTGRMWFYFAFSCSPRASRGLHVVLQMSCAIRYIRVRRGCRVDSSQTMTRCFLLRCKLVCTVSI